MSSGTAEKPSLEEMKLKLLAEATCQELQLELIRRRRFHAFDGETVATALQEHRDLWGTVMMDRVAIWWD
mgnify:CR=1 FL=1